MQHVKTKIQIVSQGAAQEEYVDLNGFKYLLDEHIDKYVLGIETQNDDKQPEIKLFTPKERFLTHGEPDVDLLDSSIKILDHISILALTASLKKQSLYKDAKFIHFKITTDNRSDAIAFLKFETFAK